MTDLADFAVRFCKMNCPVHTTEQGWPHDPDCQKLQAAVRAEAMGVLIPGDADLYDMQRRGGYVPPMRTASARIKGDKDRSAQSSAPTDLTSPLLETAPDISNELLELAYQYLSDLRYPPSPDSRERRIERIEDVLKQVQP